MKRGLLVSSVAKATEFFQEMMTEQGLEVVQVAKSAEKGRLAMAEETFDLVIINHPLSDEGGESLARYAAKKSGTQVLLAVKSEIFANIQREMTPRGIFTLSKPTNRAICGAVLQSVGVAHHGALKLEQEGEKLRQKLDDIKVVDRAKCMLIGQFSMDEQQAHRHIEKQAMDLRVSRRVVAENILKAYEY